MGPSLRRSTRLLGEANEGAAKVRNIQTLLGRRPIVAAGNSGGDREMLEWAAAGDGPSLALLVDHDDGVREFAYEGHAETFTEPEPVTDVGTGSAGRWSAWPTTGTPSSRPSTHDLANQPESTLHRPRGGAMRNEAMEHLDVLVGLSWRTTMRNAWFLEPADREVPGAATVEWLGDAFVVFRWTMEAASGPATSEMVLVLGRSDPHDAYTALYHDERGVCRVYAMTFDGSRWFMTRQDPNMFQRFIADVAMDRIAGRWEASDDGGIRPGARTSTSSSSGRSRHTGLVSAR